MLKAPPVYRVSPFRYPGKMVTIDPPGQVSAVCKQVGALWSRLVSLVYPPVCLGCSVIMARHGGLCATCWSGAEFIERPFCEVLGVPFAHDQGEGAISPAAMAEPPDYHRARAVMLYGDIAASLVHRLKYNDRLDLVTIMAAWMVRAGDGLVEKADVIVPIPLHRFRLLSRRYNQSAELSRALARLTGKPHGIGLLVRRRQTRQQVGLGEKARQRNVRGAFVVPDAVKADIAGKRVLLVDDVYTTGATVNAAARALKRAGVADVTVLTFARVPDP